MLMNKLLRVALLLFFTLEKNLLSSSRIPDESLEEPKSCPEGLAEFASSLDWIVKLFQHERLLYSNLWLSHNHVLMELSNYKLHMNDKKYIISTVKELFSHTMKLGSLADKMGALQSLDPLLNDKTAKYLIEEYPNGHYDISSTTKTLVAKGVDHINKNSDNARGLLSIKYDLTDISAIDASIWFLLNQQLLCVDPLEEFEFNKQKRLVEQLFNHRIILRADVDLEPLFKNMDAGYAEHSINRISRWYGQLVKMSPFKDAQLYDTQDAWESAGRSLILQDPKIVTDILDAGLVCKHEGKRNYLLLLHEDPAGQFTNLKPTSISEIYSCFNLGFNVILPDYRHGIFQNISKEKHAELASYLFKLKGSHLFTERVDFQQMFPYLEIASLLENYNQNLSMGHVRRFTKSFKTLELLDIIGKARIRLEWSGLMTPFNQYLLDSPTWDEAAERHFHHLISKMVLKGCQILAKDLAEYLGISIRVDDQETLPIIMGCSSDHVNYTLDKIPRYLNSLFEIIDSLPREKVDSAKRLKIALQGSIFSDEADGIAYKKDFVHYALKEATNKDLAKSPTFVRLARMHCKDPNLNIEEIGVFLHFERLVYNHFSSLERMNPEKGFQKISAKDEFSIAFKNLIMENFQWSEFPFVFINLQILEKEMLKYNPEIAIQLQLKRISTKMLLKLIYKTLGNDCADLKLFITQYLFNSQLQHTSSA